MKLDANLLRYITSAEWRILTAIEMGMKNHELVPVPLIARIANLRRGGCIKEILRTLLSHKLIAHNNQSYEGYKLTYLGYDFLALRAFVSRGHLIGAGMRVGVGKESDIHICEGENQQIYVLKLHRLGRISFRTIKKNRDYLGHRKSASWMYMARLAAAKEFAYMKALYAHKFPVPKPIDVNRHAIVMEHIDAYPLSQVRYLKHPHKVLEVLFQLIVRLAESGLIHGDFNEFNLMIDDHENITLIDFPQIITAQHPNAKEYFDRDVECIRHFFESRFRIEVTKYPKFEEMLIPSPDDNTSFTLNIDNIEDSEALNDYFTKSNTAHNNDVHKFSDNDNSDNDDESQDSCDEHFSSSSDDCDSEDNKTTKVTEEGCLSNSSDDENLEEQHPTRLDNVWKPTVKRLTINDIQLHEKEKQRKERNRRFKKNAGAKKNRDSRRILNDMKELV